MVVIFQDGHNQNSDSQKSCDFVDNHQERWDLFKVWCLHIQGDKYLQNHDVTEVESQVVNSLEDFAEFVEFLFETVFERTIIQLENDILLVCFDEEEDEKNDENKKQDATIGEIIEDEWLTYA